MSDVSRWRDSGHLERAIETAGGQELFDAAVVAMLDGTPKLLADHGDERPRRDLPVTSHSPGTI